MAGRLGAFPPPMGRLWVTPLPEAGSARGHRKDFSDLLTARGREYVAEPDAGQAWPHACHASKREQNVSGFNDDAVRLRSGARRVAARPAPRGGDKKGAATRRGGIGKVGWGRSEGAAPACLSPRPWTPRAAAAQFYDQAHEPVRCPSVKSPHRRLALPPFRSGFPRSSRSRPFFLRPPSRPRRRRPTSAGRSGQSCAWAFARSNAMGRDPNILLHSTWPCASLCLRRRLCADRLSVPAPRLSASLVGGRAAVDGHDCHGAPGGGLGQGLPSASAHVRVRAHFRLRPRRHGNVAS